MGNAYYSDGSNGIDCFLMWVPAFAALVATFVYVKEGRGVQRIKEIIRINGIRNCKSGYIVAGVVIPFIYISIPYFIYWVLNPGSCKIENLIKIILMTILGVFGSMITALGEEIGWRGFMVPALYERIGLKKTLLVSSVIWGVWHLPILVSGLYMGGTPIWYQVPAFLLTILPVGVIAGILAIHTRSVWPAAFLHAAHNNYDQLIFKAHTEGENMMFFVSETGIFTIIVAWILAAIVYCYFKKNMQIEK